MKDGSRPGVAFTDDDFLLTARQGKVIETRLQEGFLRRPLNTNGKARKPTCYRRNTQKNADTSFSFGVFRRVSRATAVLFDAHPAFPAESRTTMNGSSAGGSEFVSLKNCNQRTS